MKKNTFFLLFLFAAFCTAAGELKIVSGGKSDYQIVYFEPESPGLLREYRNACNLVQKIIFRRTGVTLPVVPASKHSGKAILIGDQQRKTPWKLNEYEIKVQNGNVVLAGDDFDKTPKRVSRPWELRLGSVKAALEFLKRFAGADFLYPTEQGIYVEKSSSVIIPDNFSLRETPALQFAVGRIIELNYGLANDKLNAPWLVNYGGHSHIQAIPPAKYLKTHPEYFAVVRGKRNGYPKIPQYCLSNKEVQELIYQKLLYDVDQPGIVEAQLGQTDGFRRCECEQCKVFYGNNPGEAIWKLHIGFAKRLQKDRPGKRVRILAYHPTRKPPAFTKEFPDNTSVTLATGRGVPDPVWLNYKVPHGFDYYSYNWGSYHTEGLTPTFNLNQAELQTKALRKMGINGFYFCGFQELPGLCNPVNLYYLRAMNNKVPSTEKFLHDYCFKLFGTKAGGAMELFYTLLYARVDIAADYESDYTMTKTFTQNSCFSPNIAILHKRYPDEILMKLEKYLNQAESGCKDNLMLKRIRQEFTYLKLTAQICNDFYKYHEKPSQTVFYQMASRITARRKFIAGLPVAYGKIDDRSGLPLFGCSREELLKNGSGEAELGVPFNWDVDYLLNRKINPSGRIIKADGKNVQQAVDVYCSAKAQMAHEKPVMIGFYSDDSFFHAVFRTSAKENFFAKGTTYIFLQKDDTSPRYRISVSSGKQYGDLCIRVKSNSENKNLGDLYKTVPQLQKKYPVKCTRSADTLTVAIPHGLWGGKPIPGEYRKVNAVWWKEKQIYIWEYNINLVNWRHRFDGIGTVEF